MGEGTNFVRLELQTRMSAICMARLMKAIIACNAQVIKSFIIESSYWDKEYKKEGNKPVVMVVVVSKEKLEQFKTAARCVVNTERSE